MAHASNVNGLTLRAMIEGGRATLLHSRSGRRANPMSMPSIQSLPWARIALAALLLAALIRAGALTRHEPLVAYANSYDQIRYSSCLDLAPWRPGVAADRANVAAPYSRFAFQALPSGWCVPSSDLAFTAPVALAWRAAESLGGRDVHSIRRLGELRLLAWIVAAAWATRAFVRAYRIDVALAHAAWLGFVAADPGITLYFSTFYAEPVAVFGLYLCGIGAVAAMLEPERARVALGVIVVGALLLATSKFQHLALPIVLGAALIVGAGRVAKPAGLALVAAGLIGLVADIAIAARDTPAARSIAMNNRADFVMSVLLPETSDVARVRTALGADDTCASYSGKSVSPLRKSGRCTPSSASNAARRSSNFASSARTTASSCASLSKSARACLHSKIAHLASAPRPMPATSAR